MNQPDEDIDELLATATQEELGVGLFTGKLHHLIKADVDLGISERDLCTLLVAINVAYEDLIESAQGVPN